MALLLSLERRAELLTLAMAERPREAVALLGGLEDGRDGAGLRIVTHLVRVDNRAGGEDAFAIDPREWRDVERELRRQGRRIVGLFHSHPRGPQRLSEADERAAGVLQGPDGDFSWVLAGPDPSTGSSCILSFVRRAGIMVPEELIP